MQEKILQSIREVPAISPSTVRLVHMIAEDDYEMEQIIEFVSLDSGLTSNMLRLINSPAFGLMKPVSSIERAVIYLGTQTVVSLALLNLNSKLFDRELEGYHSQCGEFWKHELRTALATREVVRMTGYGISPDLGFTAGLLHDIGKIVISNYQIAEGFDLLQAVRDDETVSYLELERRHLETDHCEVGALLAKEWCMPGSLETSIQFHHEPYKAPGAYRPLVYMVHLGDVLSMMAGLGTGIDNLKYTLDGGYRTYCDFSFDEIAAIMLNVEDEFQRLLEAMNEE